MTFWWQVESERSRAREKRNNKFHTWDFNLFLFKKVKFYRFKKSINNNFTIFKGFFLSGSIKTPLLRIFSLMFNFEYLFQKSDLKNFLKTQNKSSIIQILKIDIQRKFLKIDLQRIFVQIFIKILIAPHKKQSWNWFSKQNIFTEIFKAIIWTTHLWKMQIEKCTY